MRTSASRSSRTAVLLGVLLAAAVSVAQEHVQEEVRTAAAKGLEQFRVLITEKNSRELGFGSPAETRKATLGVPFREFKVRLDELAAFAPGADAAKLLHGGDEYTFPVLIDDEVRSSITIARVDGIWKPVSFGSPGRVKLASEVRVTSARAGKAAAEFSIVRVPALYVQFLARFDAGRLVLVPLRDEPRLELRRGADTAAAQVFAQLAPVARALADREQR